MFSNLKMQNMIFAWHDTRKNSNEVFIMIDSLFIKRMDYSIGVLFLFHLRLGRLNNKTTYFSIFRSWFRKNL